MSATSRNVDNVSVTRHRSLAVEEVRLVVKSGGISSRGGDTRSSP
jgi:hypothetical protein